ncbi:MAG: chromosome partitioning protein ParB [Pseudoalteromonas sp.]|uniref:portal protein n=1 Tax=Pseudoalteromonas sp. TaxID=53249 RepID=UPI001DFB242D|nr:hypothetical protein [Pseudoalteromonas sp.]NRA77134.1 chromosome partitioning protein ParB [Pseudoalteromonas sp.]
MPTTDLEDREDISSQDKKVVSFTEWKNEPSVSDLKQDLTDARSDHDTQGNKIKVWLDNLNITGAAIHKKVKGKSAVVPKLIRKQAEWRYAALSEPFLSTNDIFNVDAVTYEDKESAFQNALVLNNQFNTKLNKVSFIDQYIRAAVDEGTVIAFVTWDHETETVTGYEPTVSFKEATTQAEVDLLQRATQGDIPDLAEGLDVEVDIPEEESFALWAQAVQTSQINRKPWVPFIVSVEEVDIHKTVKNQPFVEVCDYRDIIIDPSCQGDIDKAQFVIRRFETSLSELKKDGKYENLDSINVEGNSTQGHEDYSSANRAHQFNDKPRKKIVAYEYWGFRDIHGDGVVKPIVATYVGNIMIRMEESPIPGGALPFVTAQYLPVRRSIYGEPDGALLEDNQKITGAVMRGMIDIMGRSANAQIGSRKDALDITNKIKFENGDDFEYNGGIDPSAAFYMHTYPEIPQSAPIMLQLQANEAEALTGVKAFTGSTGGDALGSTATAVRSALDATSKREIAILRRLAEGIISIGRKIIAMNAVFLDEEEVVRITNDKFVAVRRDDLAGNFDLTLTVSTAEADDQKASEISFMLQTMAQTLPFEITNELMIDLAHLRKMPALAERLKGYEPPPPDPLDQQLKQLEVAKMQVEVQELQTKAKLNAAKADTEIAKARQLSSKADLDDLDFLDKDSGAAHEREIQATSAQAQSNEKLELTKHALSLREKSIDSQNKSKEAKTEQ